MIRKYLSMHLKVALEYKASFILTIIAQTLSMFLEIFAVEALFYKFSLLDVYNINQLILSYSVVWLGFSLSETFSRGFDHFADLIVNGNFDLLLIRPRNIFLQIFGSDICYEKLGRVTLASYLVISSFIKPEINNKEVKKCIGYLVKIHTVKNMENYFIRKIKNKKIFW